MHQATVPFLRAAAQVVAATVAVPIGMRVGGYLGLLSLTDEAIWDPRSLHVQKACVIGLASASAIAVRMVGTGGAPHATMLDAAIGALPGCAVVMALPKLLPALQNGRLQNRIARRTVGLMNLLLVAIGAVLAYDLPPR